MRSKLKLSRVVSFRLDLFESRIREGWTQRMLVEDLATEGIKITVKYFDHCLNKARRKRDAASWLMTWLNRNSSSQMSYLGHCLRNAKRGRDAAAGKRPD